MSTCLSGRAGVPGGLTLPAACHSHVNHTLSELRADEKNPFSHGDYCWENDMSLESQKHLGDKAGEWGDGRPGGENRAGD